MAIQSNKGYYHIATNRQIYEPVRNNNFELFVMGLEGLLRVGSIAGTSIREEIHNATDRIRFSVKSCNIPTFQQQALDINYANNTLHYAGRPQFSDGQVVVNDYIGTDGKSILMAWQALSFDIETWGVGWAKDYKKEAYLLEYGPDMTTVIRTWKLYGVWVSNIDNGNYDNDSNDVKVVTATLSYDYAEMESDYTEYKVNE